MLRKFKYTCPNCHKGYIVELDTDSKKIFRLICNHCGYIKIVNNQWGILKNHDFLINTKTYNHNLPKKSVKFSALKNPKNRNLSFRHFWVGVPLILNKMSNFFIYHSLKFVFIFGIFLFLFGMVMLFVGFTYRIDSENYLKEINKNKSNKIFDKEGFILSELFEKKISTTEYKDIPEQMKQILLFVEDKNFFSHGGIDYKSLIRATLKNIVSFGYVQGASTITQQLSRILLGEREKKITRKIKEAILALDLERRFTKEEILTLYMNHVYLGHGAYGFENASKFYFKKPLRELNFIEMLVLASLPSRPEYYSPFRNFDHLEKKIDIIYERILKEIPDFTFPDRITYSNQKEKLKSSLNRSPYESVFGTRIDDAPYVTEFVRKRIEEILGKEYAISMGLKIYTTIDKDLQISASKESYLHMENLRKYHTYKIGENHLNEKIEKYYLESGIGGIFFGMPMLRIFKQQFETASIGLDPHTGEILFIQGGSLFQPNNQLNRAIQMRRQTGSAIKPIIYSAGIEDGILNPATILEDSPIYFSLKQTVKGYWLPENIDETYEGKISLREALEKSRNIPALVATKKIGIDRLAIQFKKFFFHTEPEFKKRFKEELAIGIGILEMSPLEMAVAYSAFANNGIIKNPYLIKKIEDSEGNVLYEGISQDEFRLYFDEKQVISGDTAEVMIDLLKSSAKFGGTGFLSERLAGKTGTTNEYRDAWFVGILPNLVAVIWVGFDNPKISMNRATGSSVAGPLFGKILKNVKEKYDVGEYQFSPNAVRLEICPKSGKLPNAFCPHRKTEIFTIKGKPKEECDYHKPLVEQNQENRKSDFE
ncbi:MAG: transglycosylase domain-containing protein [Leptonema sp. (in: bacteria)]